MPKGGMITEQGENVISQGAGNQEVVGGDCLQGLIRSFQGG